MQSQLLESVAIPAVPDLLDKQATCEFFGGTRPIHSATLYRKVREGLIPPPIRIGGSSRWSRQECKVALQRMLVASYSGSPEDREAMWGRAQS